MTGNGEIGAAHMGIDVGEPSAFALSRIQAEGWRAGRLVDGTNRAVATQAERLNPYKTPVERERWRAGFDAAVEVSRR
jgi:hypothetical protein